MKRMIKIIGLLMVAIWVLGVGAMRGGIITQAWKK